MVSPKKGGDNVPPPPFRRQDPANLAILARSVVRRQRRGRRHKATVKELLAELRGRQAAKLAPE